MSNIGEKSALHLRAVGLRMAASLLVVVMAGCASGSFSSSGPPPGGTTSTPTPVSNPPSLPHLAPATAVNSYVGTQIATPENTVAHTIDQTAMSYSYDNISIPGAMINPVPDSSGLIVPWYNFWDLGDNTGANGLPGPQHYGLTFEEASRFALFVSNNTTQLAALFPQQTSGCITPTAAATYEFVTLYGAAFNPATDAAYGMVQLSASGSSFQFSSAKQYTEATTIATTGLIPFATARCVQSSAGPELGYFIDTSPSTATGNTEVRAFLGPTGILVANLQSSDSFGNPLPLPGVLATIQPSSPVDVSALTASNILYNAVQYQPQGFPAATYGYFEGQGAAYESFISGQRDLQGPSGAVGIYGGWQNPATPTSAPASGSINLFFGPQDAYNPGLFPNAEFVYSATTPPCPAGSSVFAGTPTPANGEVYCSSPAVAIVAQHNGNYVILVTGIYVETNNSPTVMVLVQN
jgi:hypothetical protein